MAGLQVRIRFWQSACCAAPRRDRLHACGRRLEALGRNKRWSVHGGPAIESPRLRFHMHRATAGGKRR